MASNGTVGPVSPASGNLGRIFNLVESTGAWPHILSTTLVALIPKDGAKAEADLRPIGLTPIVYRVWMCLRKHCIAKWVASLYGPRILSAVDYAWSTRVEQEFARFTKRSFGAIYLDCSKRYERAPHQQAACPCPSNRLPSHDCQPYI